MEQKSSQKLSHWRMKQKFLITLRSQLESSRNFFIFTVLLKINRRTLEQSDTDKVTKSSFFFPCSLFSYFNWVFQGRNQFLPICFSSSFFIHLIPPPLPSFVFEENVLPSRISSLKTNNLNYKWCNKGRKIVDYSTTLRVWENFTSQTLNKGEKIFYVNYFLPTSLA